MDKISKIVACLDLSDLDVDIIKTASNICKATVDSVTFVNVIRALNLPEELKDEFPDFMPRALEERKKKVTEKVNKHFDCPGVNVEVEILKGQPAKAILDFANGVNSDLIISGRNKNSTTVVRSRLARRSDCSFLTVSPGQHMHLNRILIPIDFSEHAKMAVELAIWLADHLNPSLEIYLQNVYQIPSGYHYTGKSHKEFAKVMEDNASKQFNSFMRQLSLNKKYKIQRIYSEDSGDNFINAVRSEAEKLKTDLIIIGAKGQTSTSALFIGSKAERLVMMDTDASMLMVRRKGEKAGFMDFLHEL